MRHHAEMHGVRLVVEQEQADSLECDPDQIQQALLALLVNAIEAMTPAGGSGHTGGTVTITTVRSSVRNELHLSVADTGAGMTDDVKARIFEPFFTTKSEGKGVGLGLSVVYGIIEAHHGSIDVHSAPGKGTTFILTLPLMQPAPRGGGPARRAPEGIPT
jgi:two-component system NtrC family sensor kinase